MSHCNDCGAMKRLTLEGTHCDCLFYDVIDEDGDLWKIAAHSEEDAAENWAKKQEFTDLDMGEKIELKIDGVKYYISPEVCIEYSVKKGGRDE